MTISNECYCVNIWRRERHSIHVCDSIKKL